MRSLTFASVFAFALSAWSVTSTTLDKRYDQLETIETISDKYPSNTLEKRYRTSNTVYFGYVCQKKFFSKEKIDQTLKKACNKLNSKSRYSDGFPTFYEPEKNKPFLPKLFDIKYMFPLRSKGFFPEKDPGDYRITFDSHCKLKDVVKVKNDGNGRAKKNEFKDCVKAFKQHNQ